jgi:hypothetical protein
VVIKWIPIARLGPKQSDNGKFVKHWKQGKIAKEYKHGESMKNRETTGRRKKQRFVVLLMVTESLNKNPVNY